jgi:hypothetical protein
MDYVEVVEYYMVLAQIRSPIQLEVEKLVDSDAMSFCCGHLDPDRMREA